MLGICLIISLANVAKFLFQNKINFNSFRIVPTLLTSSLILLLEGLGGSGRGCLRHMLLGRYVLTKRTPT
jgi:hypothetical protein